jgi:hypothetical protein
LRAAQISAEPSCDAAVSAARAHTAEQQHAEARLILLVDARSPTQLRRHIFQPPLPRRFAQPPLSVAHTSARTR